MIKEPILKFFLSGPHGGRPYLLPADLLPSQLCIFRIHCEAMP